MNLILMPDPDDGHQWARKSDPWTSKEAGKEGFPKLRDRCLLFIWLYFKDPFTAEDIARLCEDPDLRELFGRLPLGKDPWHRITDCQGEKWLDWVYEEDGVTIATRIETSGKPQGLRVLNENGQLMAKIIWEGV